MREQGGRTAIERFQLQFRAASYAALQILDGKEIDRVYCDYHDDFVVRVKFGDGHQYDFVQVKTNGKRNYLWTVSALLSIKGQKEDLETLEKVRQSHIGKMLLHTINFKDSCRQVVFLTNVNFKDEVEAIIEDLKEDEIKNKSVLFLLKNFQKIFSLPETYDPAQAEANLRKISLVPGVNYLKPEQSDFLEAARAAVYRYSEIDLEHLETEELIENLVSLVQKKSGTPIRSTVTAHELDEATAIGIEDLLEILCISKGAYFCLLNGGDPRALKSASIIQRKLKEASAPDDVIEYCSQLKVNWDDWLRENRHSLPEFELNFLIAELADIQKKWAKNPILQDLKGEIETMYAKAESQMLKGVLSRELLLGGVFAALVRSQA